MVATRVNVFGGMIPAMDDRLLPDTAAAFTENAWLYSGRLQGIPKARELHDPGANYGKVYRIPATYEKPDHLFDSTWLLFLEPDTDIIHAPVFGDVHDRYYWVAPGLQARYNTRARIENSDPEYLLGVPAPGAISVSTAGGVSTIFVTRSYVTTWVSAYGEEGPPSDPDVVNGKTDATWTVTLPTPAAGDLGTDRNLTHVRIYRTITGTSGRATYFLVAERPITDLTYDDTRSDAVVALESQLESFDWTAPPTDLEGFIMMPNGIVAGFRENELWFSEAYRPHAWPVGHVLVVEYPIVGLGVIGQTLVVCTKGFPSTASGSTPESMTASQLANFEPCISRGSILSMPEGVYYASASGLVLVAGGVAQNITKNLVSRDRWQQLTQSARFRSARLGSAYYGFGSTSGDIFQPDTFQADTFADADTGSALEGILIDPFNERVGFIELRSDSHVYGVHNDPWSGEVLIMKDEKIFYIDMQDPNWEKEPALWRSKIYQSPVGNNFGCFQVFFSPPADFPLNPVRNTDTEQTLQPDQYGVIRLYADDRLVMTREFRQSGEVFRTPSGFTADFWQYEIETNVPVLSCMIASSPKELAAA